MTRKRLLIVLFAAAISASLIGTSQAQYMYLDANGDGVWSTADHLNANSTPTTVAVWVNTNHNRDGSLAVCDTGDGDLGTWNSYSANLLAVGGTVTFGAPVNQQPSFTIQASSASSSTELTFGRATGSPEPGGLELMFSVTITGVTGTPSITFVPYSTLGPDPTSFGTPCSGLDFDNTYKLGSDWFDVDGLSGGVLPNLPPVITFAPSATGSEGSLFSITATASDPDAGQQVTLCQTNNAPFLPPSSCAGPSASPSLTLTGTPSFTQSGTYLINWTATDTGSPAGTASATTTLSIANTNRPPTITAPVSVSGTEGTAVSVTGSASDPDAQNVTLTQTNNAPFFPASSSAGPSLNPTITLTGTPSFTQSGTYTVTWSAADVNVPAGTASATTTVLIANLCRPPAIAAPLSVSGTAGVPVTVTASVNDPEATPLSLCQTNNAPFFPSSSCAGPALNPTLTLTGTPTSAQTGTFTINWSTTGGICGNASATTTVSITGAGNESPTIMAPADTTVNEGQALTFTVYASDPNGDHVALSASGTPLGSTFLDNGDNTGTFSWTPSPTSGTQTYTVTFTGNDGRGGTASATTTIHVIDVNHAPTADPDGPYFGIINSPVTFDGSGSSDPDGDPLTYTWNFGDGSSVGSGITTTHTYLTAALFQVTLVVTDPGMLIGMEVTSAQIDSFGTATGFATGGNKTTSLGAGKPFTCIQVEPTGGTFTASDVILSSIRMISVGTGSVSQIYADASKSSLDGDKNSNGILEVTACFKKSDLRLLFSGLTAGTHQQTVVISGDLSTGGSFTTTLTMTVKSTGSALAMSISPNPLNPRAKLTFSTSQPGAVRVQMYDPQGRLVKTIADESAVGAGYHDYTIDGRSASGSKLASGIYFVKVWSQFDGQEVRALTVLK